MCGICGYALTENLNGFDEHLIRRMVNTLSHRGPDGHGSYIRPHVAFGHSRLSIIDIEGGAQPMFSEDESIALTFNGEIYNYKELKADLALRGHTFLTESDTEVIIHLYQEHGDQFLEKLNGMFAIGIWDEGRQQLLLARDRVGEKPLYYSHVRGQIIFASELKAIRHAPNLNLRVDTRALDNYLAYGYVPSPDSIYDAIKKLPQAHYLTWKDGVIRINRYWEPSGNAKFDSFEDALGQFQELLDDSIRIRLRSDVPVGAFLSGGADSSLIVARANELYSGSLQTFTIGFDEKDFDESKEAELTARHIGTRHVTRQVESLDLSILPDLVRQYDEPFADPSAVPTYYVTREASLQLKVCLSGDGADELFGGYPQYQLEPFENVFLKMPGLIRRSLLRLPAMIMPQHMRGMGWINRMMVDGAVRYQQKIGVFSSTERRELFRESYGDCVDFDASLLEPYFRNAESEIENRQTADRNTYLADDILVKVDRSSMAHSLEVRTPYLDHRLVEFATALPIRYKISGAEQKRILRAALKPLVPAEVLMRRKRGFGLPLCEWFRGEHRGFVAERLLQKDNKIFEFIEPEPVSRLITNHNRGHRDFSERIWALIWLQEWFEQFS